ncbi:MAG: tetratricopeptide repeat protein [Thermoguttaceae bacterium]
MSSRSPSDVPPRSQAGKKPQPRLRRVLNVRLLVATLVFLTIAVGGSFGWRAVQLARTARSFLHRADELETEAARLGAEGDPLGALKARSEAAENLVRYLAIHSGDAAVRIRLAEVFDLCAVNPASKNRAISLYYEALGVADSQAQSRLRRRLAELLLEQGRLAAAAEEAQKLPDSEEHSGAWSVLALALYGQGLSKWVPKPEAAPWSAGTIGAAFQQLGGTLQKAFDKALKADPGQVRLAAAAAHLYRDRPELLSGEKRSLTDLQRKELADRIIDTMVAEMEKKAEAQKTARDPAAYLARFAYRNQYGLPGAADDLQAAMACGKDKPAVWLAAAEHSRAEALRAQQAGDREAFQKHLEEASQRYRKLIELSPASEVGHRELGELLLAGGQVDEAIKTWQEGLLKANSQSFWLNSLLAEAFLARGQLDLAEKHRAAIDQALSQLGPQLESRDRLQWTQASDFLKARLHLAKGEAAHAVPLLKRIAGGQRGTPAEFARCVQAHLLLGDTYAAWNQWDRAAAAYDQAALLDPRMTGARLRAGAAWENAGRFDQAIAHFQRAVAVDPSAANWLALAGALFQRELRLPRSSRDWRPVSEALAAAKNPKDKKPLADPWRAALLEAQVLIVRSHQTETAESARLQATEILRAAEKSDPKSPALLQALASGYEQAGLPDDADRVVQALQQLDSQTAAPVLARARLQAMRRQWTEAVGTLQAGLNSLPAKEHPALLRELVQVWLGQGRLDEAQKGLSRLCDHPELCPSVPLVCQLAEVAAEAGNAQTLQDCISRLRQLEGPDSAMAAYFEARRLLAEAKAPRDPKLAEAASQQAILQSQRPQWWGTHALLGMILEAQGDLPRAIEAYEQAVSLGEGRLPVFERLISALSATGRVAEADKYLADLRDLVPASEGLAALEISVAARQSQLDRALQTARQAVQKRPNDARAHLWLGTLLSAEAKDEEAVAALRKALELSPENLQALNTLMAHYVRQKRPELARQALQTFASSEKLTPVQRAVALAGGYQILGDREQARQSYLEAVRLAPDQEAVHLGLVTFLLAGGSETDAAEAEKVLRDFLRRVPQAGNARRMLAGLLIDRGGQAEWQEALALLEQAGADRADAARDRRMQAVALLRRQGRENLQKARQILEQLVADPAERTAGDRLLLAQTYETEGDLRAAREQYLALVGVAKPPASHLAACVGFLLRHDLADEAEGPLTRLVEVAPDALRTIQLQVRWLHAQQRSGEIEPLVEAYAAKILKQAVKDKPSESQLCLNVGGLYSSVELHQAAERWYRRLAAVSPDSYGPLVLSLARQNRFAEAIELCAQAARSDDSPRPAITLASALAAGQPTDADFRLAEPLLAAAAEKHKGDASLLLGLANVRVVQQRPEDAIELYRQALTLRPKDIVVLNNLATLLGEQPGMRGEGLKVIDQAIQIAGPQPLLLDTKAMILFYDGQIQQAARLLELATTAPNADPRWRFHLAAAYERLGQPAKARDAMKQARAGKVETLLLTAADRKLLAELRQKLTP